MKEEKVSIIIPCYNMENYLDNCFKSLIKQTYKNLEIIFVDDGSKDGTNQKIQKFCSENLNSKLVSKQNGGISSARNAGLENATGDYIYFYDPDDILHPQLIDFLVKICKENNSDMSICSFKKVKDGLDYSNYKFKDVKQVDYKKNVKTIKTDLAIKKYLAQTLSDWCVWDKLYKTSIITDNNIRFDSNCRYGEDTKFNYFYLKNTTSVANSPKKLYFYVQRKTSLVHQQFKESRLDCFYSANTILNDAKNNQDVVDYAKSYRAFVSVEMLYFIKRSDYSNTTVIKKLIQNVKEGVPCLKHCKQISIFRRKFIPLVPFVAKHLLHKRLKKESGELYKSMIEE